LERAVGKNEKLERARSWKVLNWKVRSWKASFEVGQFRCSWKVLAEVRKFE